MRAIGDKIIQLPLHLSRLQESTFGLFQRYPCLNTIKLLLNNHLLNNSKVLKIILLVTLENQDLLYRIHVDEFNVNDTEPCNIIIYGLPRTNPTIKDSAWVEYLIEY